MMNRRAIKRPAFLRPEHRIILAGPAAAPVMAVAIEVPHARERDSGAIVSIQQTFRPILAARNKLSRIQEALVPEIDDATILARARMLCEQDGNFWELMARPYHFGAYMRGHLIDDTERAKYLECARHQLHQERG